MDLSGILNRIQKVTKEFVLIVKISFKNENTTLDIQKLRILKFSWIEFI